MNSQNAEVWIEPTTHQISMLDPEDTAAVRQEVLALAQAAQADARTDAERRQQADKHAADKRRSDYAQQWGALLEDWYPLLPVPLGNYLAAPRYDDTADLPNGSRRSMFTAWVVAPDLAPMQVTFRLSATPTAEWELLDVKVLALASMGDAPLWSADFPHQFKPDNIQKALALALGLKQDFDRQKAASERQQAEWAKQEEARVAKRSAERTEHQKTADSLTPAEAMLVRALRQVLDTTQGY